MEGGGGSNGIPTASNPPPPLPPPQAHVGLEMEEPGEVHHNTNPIPTAITTIAASPTTGRGMLNTGMSSSLNFLNDSPNDPPGSNRRPPSGSFAAAVRAQRRREQLEKRREERDAADELFQLGWTVIAVLYLIAVLNTSSPYIPQHDGQAAALISQTKQWLTGTPDGTAWSAASSTNYDKAHVVDNLNSTILEAMYRTHITHAVFHYHCSDQRRLQHQEEEEEEGIEGWMEEGVKGGFEQSPLQQRQQHRRFLPPDVAPGGGRAAGLEAAPAAGAAVPAAPAAVPAAPAVPAAGAPSPAAAAAENAAAAAAGAPAAVVPPAAPAAGAPPAVAAVPAAAPGVPPPKVVAPAAAAAAAAAPAPPPPAAAAPAAPPAVSPPKVEEPAAGEAADVRTPRATSGAGLLDYPSGPNILETAKCADIPTHTPHRGGVWLYMVSQEANENVGGCALQHDAVAEPTLAGPWGKSDYTIKGQLSNYHIVSECAASNSFEVMNRGDNPSRANLNAIADWAAKNFMFNTQAVIVLTQLYWEPAAKYDTFGIFLVEQGVSGLLSTSSYFYARNYGPVVKNVALQDSYMARGDTNAASVSTRATSFLMLLFFGWAYARVIKIKQFQFWYHRLLFVVLFVLAHFSEYTGLPFSTGVRVLFALPFLLYALTLLSVKTITRLFDQWSAPPPSSPSSPTTSDEAPLPPSHRRPSVGQRGGSVWSSLWWGTMDEEEAEGEAGKMAGEKGKSTPMAKRWGSALDSFLMLFIIIVTLGFQVGFAGVHSSDGRGAFLILGLFLFFLLVNIACGILRHGSSYLSAWDLVDILLIAAAVWMFHSYLLFNHLATNIRNQWLLSSETAAFMASRAPVLEVPFSLVLFLLVVRLLRHLMIFPILSVPWKTFTRSCKELLAYTVVFLIIMLAFSLLFMYNLGGDYAGLSGLATAFMTMIPTVFEGNLTVFLSGAPSKSTMVVFCNLFYAFMIIFFVANILLAIVLDHYNDARAASQGAWVDSHLLAYLATQARKAKNVMPSRAHPALERLGEQFSELQKNKEEDEEWIEGEGGREDSGLVLTDSLYSSSGKGGKEGGGGWGGMESKEADVDEKKEVEQEEEEAEESAGERTPMHLGRGVSRAVGGGGGVGGGRRGGGTEDGDGGWGLPRRQSLLSRFSTSQRQLNLSNHGGRFGGTPSVSAASTPRNFSGGGAVGGREGGRAELALLERLLESMERTDRRLARLELVLEGKAGAAVLRREG